MNESLAIGLLGIYLTIISLLSVYKMFRLQVWVEAVDDIHRGIIDSSDKYQGKTNRGRRRHAVQKIQNIRCRYPTFLEIIILIFITILVFLGIWISVVIKEKVNPMFTVGPIGIFWVIIILLNIILIRGGRTKLKEIENKLKEWNE